MSNISFKKDFFSKFKDSSSTFIQPVVRTQIHLKHNQKYYKQSLSLPQSDLLLIIIFQSYNPSSSSLACSLREPVERGHCTNCTRCVYRGSPFYIYLRTTISLLSPDAVICCSYFINVLLAIIGLKAAKLHIINCNKWKASGCIYCSTGALLQLWN